MIKASLKGLTLASALLILAACASFPSADIDPAARASLRAMSTKLADANQLQFRSKNSYDAELAHYLRTPSSATARISIERPNHLHAHIDGEGDAFREVFLDGETLTIHDGRANLYAIAAINRPNIDKALDAISEFYGFTPPLSDFVVANPFKGLTRNMQSGRHLGIDTIGGEECEHLAFSGEAIDWEIWIAKKDQLPRRYVITVNFLESNPNFTANFDRWDLDSRHPHSLFHFTPPEGAHEIEMLRAGSGAP